MVKNPNRSVNDSRDNRRFLLILLSAAAIAALAFGSFLRARSNADALIARIPERWERCSSDFCLVQSATGRWGPAWDFSYESKEYFTTCLTTLNVTLAGEVIASNPTGVLPQLNALPENPVNTLSD